MEHPLNSHYEGIEDEREWIIPDAVNIKGSYFSFWKKNEKYIKWMFESGLKG